MKISALKFLASATLLIGLGTNAANASLVTYSTRAAFDAANSGLAFEGFENVTSIGEVLSGTNIASGVQFALTSGTDAYLAWPGQSSNASQAIGVNWPTQAGWKLSFTGNTNAVGVDVYQNFGGGSQSGAPISVDVDVFGINGLLGSFAVTVPSGQAGFVGLFTGADAISYLTINNASSFDVIDNVEFSVRIDPSAVPEPGILGLFGLGMAGLMFSRKRKHSGRN